MEYQSGAISPVGSIESGWNIIKNDYWTFFGMTLVALVIVFAVSMILGAINSAITMVIAGGASIATKNADEIGKMSTALFPQIVSSVIGLFANIIITAVTGVLFCGIYKSLSRKVATNVAEFGDLFGSFDKLQACLIVSVILSFIQFVLGVGTILVGAAVGISALGLGGLIGADGQINSAAISGVIGAILAIVGAVLLINLVISVLTTFVYPILSQKDVSGGQALMLSIKSGLANFGGMLLLLILLGLLTVIGVLFCFVGVLFVAPVVVASIFAAYQSVFGTSGGFYNQMPPPPPNFGNQPTY